MGGKKQHLQQIGFTREVDDLKVPRQSPLLQPKKPRVENIVESPVTKHLD